MSSTKDFQGKIYKHISTVFPKVSNFPEFLPNIFFYILTLMNTLEKYKKRKEN